MAKRHTDDRTEKDDLTDGDNTPPGGFQPPRRTLLKALGTAAAFGGLAATSGSAAAASFTPSPSGEVVVDPGEYDWDGSGLEIGSGDALVGGGSAGDVVVNINGGTMDGWVEGELRNIVFRGANPSSKAGVDLSPGASVDGFVWPEGGQQSEDRAFYTPDGGDGRVTIRNSAWAWMVNNGAYVDKPPVTMENCAAINNNIAGIRVGHRDGTSSGQTTYVRNCLIAVTADILNDDTNSANARGLRLRAPADLVVENCWFVYLDVSGTADLIELHDGAAGSTVTIRNCAFYNDSDGSLVRDKSGGEMDVTIEDCVAVGSGSMEVEPSYSGSGIQEGGDVSFPLPSQVTGYAVADEIEGVGAGPWGDGADVPDPSDGDESGSEDSDGADEHTLVLHASPDNGRDIDVSFTVDGSIAFASEAEPDTDRIVDNDDGTATATSIDLNPDALDSYTFTGSVVDYSVPDGAVVDVAVDGTTTSFAELVGETDDGSSGDDSSDDGSSGDDSSDDGSSGDGSSDDGSSGDGSSGGSSGSLPHRISVVGSSADEPTPYTFTVSGGVARDEAASTDGADWDQLEDIARDGKVIGLVGSGTDAYRFEGSIGLVTIDGDATMTVQRNV